MLRDYQIKFNRNLALAIKQCKRVIACLPTGGGKTKCFLEITRSAIQRNRTVLIITESRKIFNQIHAEANGIEINAKIGQHLYIQPNRVYIAMAQTLVRRPFIVDQFQKMQETLLVISDEAHIGTATKLLLQLPDALLIGFTATPVYESAKHLPELYKGIVVGAQVSDLIDEGFLCSYKHVAREFAEVDKLKIKNGEYTEESQKDVFEAGVVFDGLIEDLRSFAFKKAMVFCSSISHCEDTFELLCYNGFNCVRYHSQHEFSQMDLWKFENDADVNICVSVAALNRGYDFPQIDLAALLFKTTSLPRYLQSIGRASRICEGKERFICLDYGRNWKEHNTWFADRPYETLWMKPDIKKKKNKKDELGVYPIKMCPECGAIIPTTAMVCPYCAAVIPGMEKELQQGELIEVTEGYSNMIGRRISTLNAEELAVFARLKNKKSFAIRIAKAHEQEEPGWLESFGKEMGYSYRWSYHMKEQINGEKIEFADIVLK